MRVKAKAQIEVALTSMMAMAWCSVLHSTLTLTST